MHLTQMLWPQSVTSSVSRGQGNHQACAVGHDTFTQGAKEERIVQAEWKHPDKNEGFFSL